MDLVDAELARHRLGGGAVVAGQHDDAQARRRAAPRSRRGVVALIGSATPIRPAAAVDRDEHHGLAVARAAARRARASSPGSIPQLLQQPLLPSATARPSTMPRTPLPVIDSKSLASAELEAPLLAPRRRSPPPADARWPARGWRRAAADRPSSTPAAGIDRGHLAACLRSACRSCRPPACRPWRSARAPRRS